MRSSPLDPQATEVFHQEIRQEPWNASIGLFGQVRTHRDGSPKDHNGIDLICLPGQAVLAPHDGVVTRAGWQTNPGPMPIAGYGKRIYLQHDATIHVLAHLSGIHVDVGTRLFAGEFLGTAGRTGNVGSKDKTHVHWGVRMRGEWIDPQFWLTNA